MSKCNVTSVVLYTCTCNKVMCYINKSNECNATYMGVKHYHKYHTKCIYCIMRPPHQKFHPPTQRLQIQSQDVLRVLPHSFSLQFGQVNRRDKFNIFFITRIISSLESSGMGNVSAISIADLGWRFDKITLKPWPTQYTWYETHPQPTALRK